MKRRSIFANVFLINALIAMAVLALTAIVVLQWLDIYTRHGKQVAVPDIKGLQIAEAAAFLARQSLHYTVVDSMYVRNRPAGSILETVPPVGTHVKEGRTIYLTVNSMFAQQLTIPQVMDMSQRQAEAILRSVGFENIHARPVPGAYKDLVTGLIAADGTALQAGHRVPASGGLILLVSSGYAGTTEGALLSEEPDDSLF
jgi:beta-lactam-binding protein with PASTA domain